MVSLVATSAFDGLLPLTIGAMRLTEVTLEGAVQIAPFAGAATTVGAILQKSRGLPFPAPGEMAEAAGARILWTGPNRALLIGTEVPGELAEHAALTDQGDGIAALRIDGPPAEAVLARLVPIDLRPAAFPQGRTARSLVGHMTASVTRLGPESFEVMVMRSMAGTLLHDLTEAAGMLAARP